ncbi:hypothetical protein E2C01_060111 [Portunus trituberculatus]|uniref:Uncharacterized protein n=1 Tax=Portunus trituberculatus TaxID=210409 RepID=A0A5B7H1C5_PORTR|nr:hypothetical protein [Portunus trituberculatus]
MAALFLPFSKEGPHRPARSRRKDTEPHAAFRKLHARPDGALPPPQSKAHLQDEVARESERISKQVLPCLVYRGLAVMALCPAVIE